MEKRLKIPAILQSSPFRVKSRIRINVENIFLQKKSSFKRKIGRSAISISSSTLTNEEKGSNQ